MGLTFENLDIYLKWIVKWNSFDTRKGFDKLETNIWKAGLNLFKWLKTNIRTNSQTT